MEVVDGDGKLSTPIQHCRRSLRAALEAKVRHHVTGNSHQIYYILGSYKKESHRCGLSPPPTLDVRLCERNIILKKWRAKLSACREVSQLIRARWELRRGAIRRRSRRWALRTRHSKRSNGC